MLALDAAPELARLGVGASDVRRPRRSSRPSPPSAAEVVTPPPPGLANPNGATAPTCLSPPAPRDVDPPAVSPSSPGAPVVDLVDTPTPAAGTTWTTGSRVLGAIDHVTGPQGISAAPGALLPITLRTSLPAYATSLNAAATGPVQLDALLLIPTISTLRLGDCDLADQRGHPPAHCQRPGTSCLLLHVVRRTALPRQPRSCSRPTRRLHRRTRLSASAHQSATNASARPRCWKRCRLSVCW